MWCDVHLVVRLASVVGMNAGVSKNNGSKVLVVPFIPHVLLVFDEEASMLSLVIEVQCWEHQLVQ